MTCSNCGAPLTPGLTACPQCGFQFSQPVPAFYPAAPPQAKKTSPWVWIIGCGAIGCLPMIAIFAAILFPVFAKAREKARMTTCMTNQKELGLAMLQYCQDYDQKMPAAATWNDETYPYIKVNMICPDAMVPAQSTPGHYGYAFYSDLNKISLADISKPEDVPVFYDSSNLNRNATDSLTSLPDPPRHDGEFNIVTFLDGHVKAIKGSAK